MDILLCIPARVLPFLPFQHFSQDNKKEPDEKNRQAPIIMMKSVHII